MADRTSKNKKVQRDSIALAQDALESATASLTSAAKRELRAKDLLRESKIKRTRPRLGILMALIDNVSPRTVDQVFTSVHNVDLVTVYRTLDLFVERNLVREVRFKDSPVRYELSVGHHHHHVVCTDCGSIDELPECDIQHTQIAALTASQNFVSITDHALEFFGQCKPCAAKVL